MKFNTNDKVMSKRDRVNPYTDSINKGEVLDVASYDDKQNRLEFFGKNGWYDANDFEVVMISPSSTPFTVSLPSLYSKSYTYIPIQTSFGETSDNFKTGVEAHKQILDGSLPSHTCSTNLQSYRGFIEEYQFCTVCDKKFWN